MIIQAKATKENNKAEDPGQRFIFKSMDHRTNTPYAIGVALLAFLIYLRAFVTGKPLVEEEEAKRPSEDAEGEGSESDAESLLLAAEEVDPVQTNSVESVDNAVAEVEISRSPRASLIDLGESTLFGRDFFLGPVQGNLSRRFGGRPTTMVCSHSIRRRRLSEGARSHHRNRPPAEAPGGRKRRLSGPRLSFMLPPQLAQRQAAIRITVATAVTEMAMTEPVTARIMTIQTVVRQIGHRRCAGRFTSWM
ncbi:hypothetical protein [Hoeflea ulvae]|uniref:Uncharacterized protein n=1 Tax=Hoeflea ulvae TaxID=2983764 RepID=A0ABT3YM50_9HYPH|nr:hypothetical protein [Hoeflea ulvae]MCY0096965.1 hypothetical protein [Hoeflea ulvae]